MKKIKVLFTIPNFDTAGSGKALLKIATRLNKDIFEPHIACFHTEGDYFDEVIKSGIPFHVKTFTIPFTKSPMFLWKCWQNRKFFAGFDIVHSFHYKKDISEALAARWAGCKWVYSKKNMKWGSRGWKWRTRLSDGVVALCPEMLQRFFPDNPKVFQINRGVDTAEFFPQAKSQALLHKYQINPGEKVLAFVANIVPLKGLEELLDAYKILYQKHPRLHLLIVGDDRSPYAQTVKAKAALVGGNIHFAGKQLDVAGHLSIADVFIIPSHTETGPVCLLEAMACGIPSLGSNVSGINNIFSHRPQQLFAKSNVAEMVEKVEWMLAMPEAEKAELVEMQHEIIASRFSLEAEVKAHEAFYLKVLGIADTSAI